MTTKRELREALQRLLDDTDEGGLCLLCGDYEHADSCPVPEARAILARPAVVVGYRIYYEHIGDTYDWRTSEGLPVELCRKLARDEREKWGGDVRKLVVR
jgi:hypothetical protein